jgi:aldehyde:ferredoxin oxidoreductase
MLQYQSIKINLSTGEVKTEPISERVLTDFIGGRGFGAYYVYRDVPPSADPLGPDNKLLLLAGPLAGVGSLSTSLDGLC